MRTGYVRVCICGTYHCYDVHRVVVKCTGIYTSIRSLVYDSREAAYTLRDFHALMHPGGHSRSYV
jgi:hypothetical protein